MVIVTGSVQSRPDAIDEVLALSLEHVRRSRSEPGCLLHSVHQDVEDPLHVVFVEHWADEAALVGHFAVPASGDFVTRLGELTTGRPTIDIYTATPATL
jgi:quinol monooxygenase YgiN